VSVPCGQTKRHDGARSDLLQVFGEGSLKKQHTVRRVLYGKYKTWKQSHKIKHDNIYIYIHIYIYIYIYIYIWIAGIEEDLQIMGVRRWRKQCEERADWKKIAEKAKPHRGS